MEKLLKPANLPLITAATGAVGLLLRLLLFSATVDSSGYLVAGHPAQAILWVLTAAVLLALFLGTRSLQEGNKYSFNFPPSLVGAVGCLLGAASFAITSGVELTVYTDTMTVLTSLLGFASAVCLGFIGYRRWMGKRTNFLLHTAICLYLMMRLVCQYRHWSSDPQMLDYCFQLLATVFLMLAGYHRAAFAVNRGSRHSYVFFHLSAVYFCLVSLIGSESIVFYLGAGAWMLTDLCNLSPMPSSKRGEA